MEFEKDHLEDDNDISRLEEEDELAGDADEAVEVEEIQIVAGSEDQGPAPAARIAARPARKKPAKKRAPKKARKKARKPAKKARKKKKR